MQKTAKTELALLLSEHEEVFTRAFSIVPTHVRLTKAVETSFLQSDETEWGESVCKMMKKKGVDAAFPRVCGFKVVDWKSKKIQLGGLAPITQLVSARDRFGYYAFEEQHGEENGLVFIWVSAID